MTAREGKYGVDGESDRWMGDERAATVGCHLRYFCVVSVVTGYQGAGAGIRFAATATVAVRMCIGAVGVGGSWLAQWCMFEQ